MNYAAALAGNVKAEIGESDAGYAGPPPGLFMPQSPVPVPTVKPGLTIDPSAKIEGDLEYTQTRELTFPTGVIAGKVTRKEPAVNAPATRQETTSEKVLKWALNVLRTSITLVLIGLVLLWLFPSFVQGLSAKLQTAFLPSLGWGIVAYAGFFFMLLFTIVVMVLGGLLFGVLTLGGLARHGCLAWDSGVIRFDLRLCTPHILRRENCIWSGNWKMDPQPAPTRLWQNIGFGRWSLA